MTDETESYKYWYTSARGALTILLNNSKLSAEKRRVPKKAINFSPANLYNEGGTSGAKMQTYKDNIVKLLVQIGFKQSAVDKLSAKPHWDLYYHNDYSDHDAIVGLIEDVLDAGSLQEYLQKIGLRKTKAAKYANIFENADSHSYDQIMDMIVSYVLGEYGPIGPTGQPYLYVPEKVDEWFTTTIDGKQTRCYNIKDPSPKKLESSLSSLREGQLYFHACIWPHARDIITSGVIRDYGRMCLDFGIRRSFYTTPDLATALNNCTKLYHNMHGESAIVVFCVLGFDGTQYKKYSSATDEWVDKTTESRQCKLKKNALDAFDFVYGPMVANVKGVKRGERACAHRPPKFQLASKSDRSDSLLSGWVHGIMFLKKH